MSFDISALITDRTAADVARVKALSAKGWAVLSAVERTEWLGGVAYEGLTDSNGETVQDVTGADIEVYVSGTGAQKGAYNASDMNRVGEAMIYVRQGLAVVGYYAQETPKTDWSMQDIPTAAQLLGYAETIHSLRDSLQALLDYYSIQSDFPLPDAPETVTRMTYTTANDIEQILKTAIQQLDVMYERLYWYCSGDLYAGEV